MPSPKPAKAAHDPGSQRDRAVLVGVQLPGVTDADHASDLAELGRLVAARSGFDVVGDGDAAARRAGRGGGARRGQAQGARGAHGRQGRRAVGRARGEDKARARWAGASERTRRDDETTRRTTTKAATGRSARRSSSSTTRSRRARRATSSARPGRGCSTARRHRRHLPPPRAEPRGARSQVEIARLNVRRAAPARVDRRQGAAAREGAPARRRSSSTGARSATASPSSASSSPPSRRSRRTGATPRQDQLRVALVGYTNAGKSSLMRGAHREPGPRRGQALRDARHDGARAAAGDEAAHPRLRHRGLHQEAPARSRRLVPVDARRGARGVAAALRRRRGGPGARGAARGDARGAARDRRRRGPEPAPPEQGRPPRRRARAEALLRRASAQRRAAMLVSAHDPAT